MKITFVTSNKDKYYEAKKIAEKYGVEIDLNTLELKECRGTFKQISLEKAKQAYEKIKKPLIVEDAGIIIEHFSKNKEFPGVFSKYIYQTLGLKGILKAMEGLKKEERKAHFISIITYIDENQTKQFEGRLEGYIAYNIYEPKDGWKGMMYDKIFIPQHFDKTISMLGLETKNKISHRRKALEKFLEWITKN